VNHALKATHFVLPRIEEIQKGMLEGNWALSYDMKSWFHQFALAESVQPYYGIIRGKHTYAPTRLPMGMRRSCEIAQFVIKLITKRAAASGAKTFVYIDNVIFIGTKDVVQRAGRLFKEDAEQIGATIGQADTEPTQNIAFVGLQMDLNAKTSTCTQKVSDKEKLLWEHRDRWSNADHSAWLSTLWFIQRCKRISKAPAFDALNVWRRLHKRMQASQDRCWSQPTTLSKQSEDCLKEWRAYVLESPPEIVRPANQGHSILIATDASENGWGAVAMNKDGTVSIAAGALNKLKHSADSEPFGLYHALAKCYPKDEEMNITVLCDNKGLVDAFNRGYSARWSMNRVIGLLAQRKKWTIRLQHIPGNINPADWPSRSLPIPHEAMKKFFDWITGVHPLREWGERVSSPPRFVPLSTEHQRMDMHLNAV
jgi:hypothetical protein